MALPYPLRQARMHVRRFVRSLGWDIVRYRPIWSTLLGAEALPVRTILDIGAYNGDTAATFLRLFPYVTLYRFEPLEGPLRTLDLGISAAGQGSGVAICIGQPQRQQRIQRLSAHRRLLVAKAATIPAWKKNTTAPG